MMFRRLQRLYEDGRLEKEGVLFYYSHGLLSKEEYKTITGDEPPKKV